MGHEFEYSLNPKYSHNPENGWFFNALLEPLREKFGGSPIRIRPWNKDSNAMGSVYAEFVDLKGRSWQAVPETASYRNAFNDFELITPPLTSTQDVQFMKEVLIELEKTGLFIKGEQSSTHTTFDVSDLMEANGNISKLVDLILFLENNIIEIYNLIKPKRDSTVMNVFAVPMALDQKNLLHELAALPKGLRTYNNVREVFKKYLEHERALVEDFESSMWKFRAFNYGKLLKLGRVQQVNAIEARIGDLVGPEDFIQTRKIYEALIKKGTAKHISKFTEPFKNVTTLIDPSDQLPEINKQIANLSTKKFASFVRRIGLDPKNHKSYKFSKPQTLSCKSLL